MKRWIVVLGVHLVLATLWTWPALEHFDTSLFGSGVRGDKYQFIWNFWWMKHALFELHQLPYVTGLQFHPTGTSLALHDLSTFWALASLPLQVFTSPAVAFNLLMLVCFPANGLAAYALAREVTGRHAGALAASVLFACCPYLLKCFRVSHISLLGVFFFPLFVLELWRYDRDRRPAALARAGVYLGLTTLMHYHYAVALGLLTVAWLAFQLVRTARRAGGPGLSVLSRHVAMMASIAILLSSPAILPGLIELSRGDFAPRSVSGPVGYEHMERGSADVATLFLPDFTNAEARLWSLGEAAETTADSLRESLTGSIYAKSVYPGFACWAAIALVACIRPLRERYAPWAWLGCAGFILALGPTLTLLGEPYLRGGLPARILASVPVLDLVGAVSRFAILLSLGGAVCVAGVVAYCGSRGGVRLERALAAGIVGLTLLEFLPHPTGSFPNDIFLSSFYERVRDEPGDFAILNVPVDLRGAKGGGDIYLYAQTVHQKRMVGGYVSHAPRYVTEPLDQSPFLRALHHRRYERVQRLQLPNEALEDLEPTLERLGIRYVVLHRIELQGPEWQRVNAWLAPKLGDPIFEDRWIRAYAYRKRPVSAERR